jgi:hypothetical protein
MSIELGIILSFSTFLSCFFSFSLSLPKRLGASLRWGIWQSSLTSAIQQVCGTKPDLSSIGEKAELISPLYLLETLTVNFMKLTQLLQRIKINDRKY